MHLKLFGDTQKIDWQALNGTMPFAPMHELAKKYELIEVRKNYLPPMEIHIDDLGHIFECDMNVAAGKELFKRIKHRTNNTLVALKSATSDTICINLGGGYHHAGKYPNTGYAYSLINDHIWAVDYQLDQHPDIRIGIWDIDFHYAGGTIEYYIDHPRVDMLSESNPLHGTLHKHQPLKEKGLGCYAIELDDIDKVLLNLGTDYSTEDALFGQYAWYNRDWVLALWKNTITEILEYKKPLAITFGGSYGDKGISMYEELIDWIQQI